jgi:hypothetical protein
VGDDDRMIELSTAEMRPVGGPMKFNHEDMYFYRPPIVVHTPGDCCHVNLFSHLHDNNMMFTMGRLQRQKLLQHLKDYESDIKLQLSDHQLPFLVPALFCPFKKVI